MIEIEQTLHGYNQGHRLLAQSSELRADELDQLVRLSDLAGYLPAGLNFDSYLTGFPCGRFYALASTWPDFDAPRSGAVLTHSLLIPAASTATLPDLLALGQLHRQPSHGDWSSYTRPTVWAESGSTSSSADIATSLKDIVALLLFGQDKRPIVWIDHGDLSTPLRWAWQLLGPRHRATWSFCTLALQPRTVGGEPFSWLAAPPEARAGLHRLAASKAWAVGGRIQDPVLARRMNEGWVLELRDPTKAQTTMYRAELAGITHLELHYLPLASRFFELAEPAAQRLAAARTRADLLAKIAPNFADAPSAWREVLLQLVEHQSSAALDPRPLWELDDLLSRGPLQESVGEPEADLLRERLSEVVGRELEQRIRARPGASLASLPSLYHHAEICHIAESVIEAARRTLMAVVTAHQDTDEISARIRSLALHTETSPRLVAEFIRSIPPEEQTEILTEILANSRDDDELNMINCHLADPGVALTFSIQRGVDIVSGLEMAARIHLGTSGAGADWRRALESTTAADAWGWSMLTNVASRSQLLTTWRWCGRGRDHRELAEAARTHGRGGEAMAAIINSQPRDLSREIFLDHPDLAVATVTALLVEADPEGSFDLRSAVGAVAIHFLVDEDFLTVLQQSSNSRFTEGLLRALLPGLLRQVTGGADVSASTLRKWLSTTEVQRTIARSSIRDMEAITLADINSPTAESALTTVAELLDPTVFSGLSWATPILCAVLRRASKESVHRASTWLTSVLSQSQWQLDSNSDQASRLFLMGETLGAIRRTKCLKCTSLVAIVYPVVHAKLQSGYPGSLKDCEWWNDWWWDRAKGWRRWLLDAAAAGQWPDSILREIETAERLLPDELE